MNIVFFFGSRQESFFPLRFMAPINPKWKNARPSQYKAIRNGRVSDAF